MLPRQRAVFRPFPPDLDVDSLVNTEPQFEYARRIDCNAIDQWPREDFERLVHLFVLELGKPLVIEGFQDRLHKGLFTRKWLKRNHSTGTLSNLRVRWRLHLAGSLANSARYRQSRTSAIWARELTWASPLVITWKISPISRDRQQARTTPILRSRGSILKI